MLTLLSSDSSDRDTLVNKSGSVFLLNIFLKNEIIANILLLCDSASETLSAVETASFTVASDTAALTSDSSRGASCDPSGASDMALSTLLSTGVSDVVLSSRAVKSERSEFIAGDSYLSVAPAEENVNIKAVIITVAAPASSFITVFFFI